MKYRIFTLTAASIICLSGLSVHAQDQTQTQTHDMIQLQEQLRDRLNQAQDTNAEDTVYGSQLMTEQERLEYRNRLQNAATEEERLQIRTEHHQQMQERASEQGVTLPDMPPQAKGKALGKGMGKAIGQDKDSNAGAGMGQGMGGNMQKGGGGGRH